ncbi:hypothetical protein ADU00_11665 [Salmonella enterica subsp. enterica]|nr:hypothetical protein [Salmonella enterica subsp. enterica serovar Hvittingfoss]
MSPLKPRERTPDGATTQVSAGITKSSGADASLTQEADKNITISKNITASGDDTGKLNVNLLGTGSSNGKVLINDAHQCQRLGCECAPVHSMTIDVKNGVNITAGNISFGSYRDTTDSEASADALQVTVGNTVLNCHLRKHQSYRLQQQWRCYSVSGGEPDGH